jgi:uncharacterized protein YqeY
VLSLRRDLTAALKERDPVAVAALRSAISAIENAEAVDAGVSESRRASSEYIAGVAAGVGSADVERRALSDAELVAIVCEQVEERTEAADGYEKLGRHDQAARLRREADRLREYL